MSARAVVLIGSPRPPGKSASESLANYLDEQLAVHDVAITTHRITHSYQEAGLATLLTELKQADIFVLASPLYIDSLPYLVTRVFERIAAARSAEAAPAPVRFLAIINCGFPEARHTYVALDICRVFAQEAQLAWAGGLGLGGGETITGTHLQDLGWLTANIRRSLDLAAAALATNAPLPPEAAMLMAQPLVPARAYTLMAAARWYRRAFEHGVVLQLRAKPFGGGGGHSRL